MAAALSAMSSAPLAGEVVGLTLVGIATLRIGEPMNEGGKGFWRRRRPSMLTSMKCSSPSLRPRARIRAAQRWASRASWCDIRVSVFAAAWR